MAERSIQPEIWTITIVDSESPGNIAFLSRSRGDDRVRVKIGTTSVGLPIGELKEAIRMIDEYPAQRQADRGGD